MTGKQCKFCYENKNKSDFISPCLCSGSMKYVHRECLNKWRSIGPNPSVTTHCQECKFEYEYEFENNSENSWKIVNKCNECLIKRPFILYFLNFFYFFFISFLQGVPHILYNNRNETVVFRRQDMVYLIKNYYSSVRLYLTSVILLFIGVILVQKNKVLYIQNFYSNPIIFLILFLSILFFNINAAFGLVTISVLEFFCIKRHYVVIEKIQKISPGIVKNLSIKN